MICIEHTEGEGIFAALIIFHCQAVTLSETEQNKRVLQNLYFLLHECSVIAENP